jgi:integrase
MERRRVARVLSAGEVGRLLENLPEPSRAILALGICTGLRIGELLGLRVEDADLHTGTLHIRRAVYRGEVGTAKTPGSERRVPLAGFVVAALKVFLSNRRIDSEWLFSSEALIPLDDRNLIRRQVEPVCDRLGIKRFSWHSLRHTFSTVAGDRGVSLTSVQSLLGHSNLGTTMIYTHPIEETKRQAVEEVARVLCPNVPKAETQVTEGSKLIQ